MQLPRRGILAAVPTLLAGCGRSLRDNSVPGGLRIENRRSRAVTVSVSASRRPAEETDGRTDSPTPETPTAFEDASLTGEYEVPADDTRAVPDFFPGGGQWAVEAVVDDQRGGTRIELYASVPGPAGTDTVRIRVTPDGVTAEASTVD